MKNPNRLTIDDVPSVFLSIVPILNDILSSTFVWEKHYFIPAFMDGNFRKQRSSVTCPKPHS